MLACTQPGRAYATIGAFTVSFAEGIFRANGDFVIPGAVHGVAADGDFRADRAFGNYQTQEVTLVGHVVLHRRPASLGRSAAPLTLTCRQLRIESKRDLYTATGDVVAVQGARRLHSDYLQLSDATREGLLRGDVRLQENDRSLATSQLQYNLATGALNVPVPLSGAAAGMDFRADRATGNTNAGTLLLSGDVVVRRFSAGGRAPSPGAPLTLWCDRLNVVKTTYTATGHVRLAQGDRTLTAPIMRLNDATHVATLTGGVHGEQPPDRTLDAADVLYNTQTQDATAQGGVNVTFPFQRGPSSPRQPAARAGLPAAQRAASRMERLRIAFSEGTFRGNGDFAIPGAVHGVAADGDFRADRAFGNYQTQEVTLVGRVVVHRRAASSGAPLTLTCDRLRMQGGPRLYTALGNVVAVQASSRLRGDYVQLNDATHEALLRGDVHLQDKGRSLTTSLLQDNLATGAVNVPVPLSGTAPDMDFRADRATGNTRARTLLLSGDVVVHRFSGVGQGESRREPVTLWCDRLKVVKAEYTATGHVRLAQGDRTLVAPVLRLNDTTHVATLTGGVHGEQPPDRTFDAPEILYNTQTQDFKALGGVKATFPFRRGGPASSPPPASRSSASPSSSPRSGPAPPTASPSPALRSTSS